MPPSDHPQNVVDAIGKASEALEYVERARGHLFEFHQLMGRADFEFGHACEALREAGLEADAEAIERLLVGRNVLRGRWTFQIVDEFEDVYHVLARGLVRDLERDHLDGIRHEHERRMKEQRRTHGMPGHEAEPAAGD